MTIESITIDRHSTARCLRCAGSGPLPPGAFTGEEYDGRFVGWWFAGEECTGLGALVATLVTQFTSQPDPFSLRRLAHAQRELAAAVCVGDPIGALLDAADCCSWTARAIRSGLLTPTEGDREMVTAVLAGGQGPAATVLALWTRYQRRTHGGEDDAAERVDVILALCGEDTVAATASALTATRATVGEFLRVAGVGTSDHEP